MTAENIIKKVIEAGYHCEGTTTREVKDVEPIKGREGILWLAHVCIDGQMFSHIEERNGEYIQVQDNEKHYKGMIIKNPFMDAEFWKILVSAYGWLKYTREDGCRVNNPDPENMKGWVETWKFYALHFNELYLTEGFNSAVEWFTNLIK